MHRKRKKKSNQYKQFLEAQTLDLLDKGFKSAISNIFKELKTLLTEWKNKLQTRRNIFISDIQQKFECKIYKELFKIP